MHCRSSYASVENGSSVVTLWNPRNIAVLLFWSRFFRFLARERIILPISNGSHS